MPLPEEMASEKERLYESSSLRDDLNDDEATVLLEWGEKQVERLAQEFPEEFEKKARFMRQLMKGINRFVGQREFNEMEGQAKYMSKIAKYLEPLGWTELDSSKLFEVLPENKSDMAANLSAILGVLSPAEENQEATPTEPARPQVTASDMQVLSGLSHSAPPEKTSSTQPESTQLRANDMKVLDKLNQAMLPTKESSETTESPEFIANDMQVLENLNHHSITQAQDDHIFGKHTDHGEEQDEQ